MKINYNVLISQIVFYFLNVYGKEPSRAFEVDLTLEERIKVHGYPVEVHQVTTDDGYILPVYRIPHGKIKTENESKNKSVFILVHGMGGISSNFIIIGKKSFPYYFADKGFEVWLFSARGNPNVAGKKQHKTLDWNKDDEYWMYSYHQIGMYDLAATIDYALNVTGQEAVFVAGHSAGGAEIYAMLSERPEYNKKVKCHVSMGSAPLLGHSDYSAMVFLASLGPFWKGVIKYIGGYGEMGRGGSEIARPLLRRFCADPQFRRVCRMAPGVVGSHREVYLQDEDMDAISADLPTRMSVMQIFHFMDNYRTGNFVKYDFGPEENMKKYGQRTPPPFNLSAVTAPSAFFTAIRDDIVTKEDVLRSAAKLPNVVWIHEIQDQRFTHVDYIFVSNTTLVFEPLLELFTNIDNGKLPPRIVIKEEDLIEHIPLV